MWLRLSRRLILYTQLSPTRVDEALFDVAHAAHDIAPRGTTKSWETRVKSGEGF